MDMNMEFVAVQTSVQRTARVHRNEEIGSFQYSGEYTSVQRAT
jgi:hypothetical protein